MQVTVRDIVAPHMRIGAYTDIIPDMQCVEHGDSRGVYICVLSYPGSQQRRKIFIKGVPVKYITGQIWITLPTSQNLK